MTMSRRNTLIAAAAAALVKPFASRAAHMTPTEPGDKYVVSWARPNMRLGGQTLINLPTFVIVNLMQGVSVLGGAAKAAYDAEGKRADFEFEMPSGYGHYVRVAQVVTGESCEGASYGWTKLAPNSATYSIALHKRGLFHGSSWYGSYIVMVGQNPRATGNPDEIATVVARTVEAIRAAEQKAGPFPKGEIPRSRQGSGRHV